MSAGVDVQPATRRSGDLTIAWLATAAALLLGVGTSSTNPTAATLVALLAFGVACLAGLGYGKRVLGALPERSVLTVLAVSLIAETAVGLLAPAVTGLGYAVVFAAMGLVATYALVTDGRGRQVALAIAIATHFALMVWMIQTVPLRDQDVHVVHQEAASALLSGRNPYGITFPNIYGYGTPLYPLELQEGDRVLFGLPYPPLSLLMALPGHVLAGDYRYAALAAISLSAALLAWVRPGHLATGASLLLLLSPLTARVLHNGWTEPFVALMLVAVLLLSVRRLGSTTLALGLLIATKQYAPLFLPLGLRLLDVTRQQVGLLRMAGISVGLAVATVVPFLVWNYHEFLFSVVVAPILWPFRPDGSSLPALLARWNLWVPPLWSGFVVTAVVMIWVMVRSPRTPSGFAIGSAIVLVAFFLLSKQAAMNYYFVAMVALLGGVAATTLQDHT